eukprot:RCo033481
MCRACARVPASVECSRLVKKPAIEIGRRTSPRASAGRKCTTRARMERHRALALECIVEEYTFTMDGTFSAIWRRNSGCSCRYSCSWGSLRLSSAALPESPLERLSRSVSFSLALVFDLGGLDSFSFSLDLGSSSLPLWESSWEAGHSSSASSEEVLGFPKRPPCASRHRSQRSKSQPAVHLQRGIPFRTSAETLDPRLRPERHSPVGQSQIHPLSSEERPTGWGCKGVTRSSPPPGTEEVECGGSSSPGSPKSSGAWGMPIPMLIMPRLLMLSERRAVCSRRASRPSWIAGSRSLIKLTDSTMISEEADDALLIF